MALNCIHAISDIDRDEGPLRTGLAYGAEAARKVALHFRRWMSEGEREHPREWGRIWRETWNPDPVPDEAIVRRGSP